MASDLAGFRTICVKSNEKCVSYHYLYYKKHETREKDESKPQDKTLFVVNIPPYCTKVSLERIIFNGLFYTDEGLCPKRLYIF